MKRGEIGSSTIFGTPSTTWCTARMIAEPNAVALASLRVVGRPAIIPTSPA
jgi:hypothetical protein